MWRPTAQQLREQIAALSDQLARAETELADLATIRKTLTALTGEPETTDPADTTIASVAYQQILAAFTTATGPMRAKDVCRALGLGTAPKDTEGLRVKLKRIVARQVLIESSRACSPSRHSIVHTGQLSSNPDSITLPPRTMA